MLKFLKELYTLNIIYTVIGIANTALLLFYVGVSQTTDIWFASLVVVTSFAKLFMTGFLNEVFLPRLVRAWPNHPKYAEHLLANIFTVISAISLFSVLIISVSSTVIVDLIYSQMAVDMRYEIARVMRWGSPALFLIVINELLAMTLHSREIYGQAERARIFASSLNFLIVLSLYSKIGIWALYAAMIVSHSVNFLFMVYAINAQRIKIGFSFRSKTWKAARIKSKISVSTFYILVTQLYLLLFRSYLASFSPGMITVFHYVETVIVKCRSLIMRPISIVTLTDFSKTERQRTGLDVWRQILAVFILLTLTFFFAGLLLRYYGIYLLLYVLESQEYYQLIWFRSLLAVYVLLVPFELILVVLRKKLVSMRLFSPLYLYSGFSQIGCIALILFAKDADLVSLYMIYAIAAFDVVSKIAIGLFLMFKANIGLKPMFSSSHLDR